MEILMGPLSFALDVFGIVLELFGNFWDRLESFWNFCYRFGIFGISLESD